ncbi:Uncharacterized protein PECH_000296 [Penicillium ucsense]|uniref:Integral membrane protein n=1 Tax=Penicillium ucsense TaxID=2839758 RepID=A0A8J8W0E9_9EURO|nr:Uncharacterized protein PECM_008707 [Penicillium ucsense]KAF7733702.1 Uncharacterized protein PECH_000296 [Penicillium ucsense]
MRLHETWSHNSPRLVILFVIIQAQRALAQQIVSSTAAWSSQIVAFWGAIIIASQVGKVGTGGTSVFSSVRASLRARSIANALSRGNWFLHSGWSNGSMRMDIAIVHWQSASDLTSLARRIAMQIETFGDKWQVLVLGQEVKKSDFEKKENESVIHWIKSPRSERFCGAKVKSTGENLFRLREHDLVDALDMLKQTPPVPAKAIVEELLRREDTRASRPTYLSEQHNEMKANSGQLSWGYIFTNIDHQQSPFLALKRWTGPNGIDRGARMVCATRMYLLVHLLIACAVGLMAAATGRGLAVWLMTVRPTISTMGGKDVNGNDVLRSLLCMDEGSFQYETRQGSRFQAGDVVVQPMGWWQPAVAFAIPSLETAIILAGWFYGALNAKRLEPSGVVGHGMLWLSIVVGLSLCVRALFTLRNHDKGRLVGIWKESDFVRFTVGTESLELQLSELQRLTSDSPINLIATILADEGTEADAAIRVVESLLRLPVTTTLLEHLVATEIMKFKYEGDKIITKAGKPISPKSESPWIQSYCCIALVMVSSCVSAVYAYYPLPRWSKLVTEVVIAVSAVFFNSVDLVGSFMHEKETSICFMVAALVTSSVWYVGLESAG